MSPRNATEIGQRRHYVDQGNKYPSTTTLLKIGRPKEWMGAWAAKSVAYESEAGVERWGANAVAEWARLDRELHEATLTHRKYHQSKCPHIPSAIGYLKGTPWRKRDAAADVGKLRHKTLEAIAAEEAIPADAPGREQLEQWRDGYRPLILESEAQVVNRTVGYAGSLDLIVEQYGDRLVVDLKTSRLYTDAGQRKTVDRDWCLQLAAYRYAEFIFEDDRTWTMPELDGAAVLWVPSDAPDEWMYLRVPAGAPEWRAFLAAKQTYDDFTAFEKQAIGELILPQSRGEAA